MIRVEIIPDPDAYGDIDVIIDNITTTLKAADAAALADLIGQALQDIAYSDEAIYEENGRNIDNAYNEIEQARVT